MNKRILPKNQDGGFYLPGEEINVKSDDMFLRWDTQDGANTRKKRLFFCIFCCSVAYMLVGFRLFGAGVLPNIHNYDETRSQTVQRKAAVHRADILDRNGTILAASIPIKNLNINTRNILSPRQTAENLVNIFPELEFDEIYSNMKRKNFNFTPKRNLSPQQQVLVNSLGNPGLEFLSGEKRVYPHKNLFSHIIGTSDPDNNGTSGIEKGLDERITTSELPLRLTVDMGIQDTIRSILSKHMKKYKAKGATAILMEASTGNIISMVSLPDFDPNDIKKTPKSNMASSYVYEPGSVFKVFNAAMSIDSGKIKVSETFDATQPLKIKGHIIRDFRGENRWLSVEEILIHSSNIGATLMALKSGFNEQYNFLKKLKMFERLNLELVETAKPLVIPKERWRKTESNIATISYGHGISVTPLHVLAGFNAVINGGTYYSPSFISGRQSGERVISDNTSRHMRKFLRAVVVKGSGRKADVAGYEVGGKTGTAEKISSKGKYDGLHKHNTFVSAFPMSNPQYSLLVMMDEPQAVDSYFSTAGYNVVPASAEIISTIAPQLNIMPKYDDKYVSGAKLIEASY